MCYLPLPKRLLLAIGFLLLLSPVSASYAVPSFSRQTGLQCSGCHTAYPQLNAFGRQFKMQGYTLAGGEMGKVNDSGFSPLATAPISLMIQATLSRLDKSPDPGTDSSQVKLPAQLSLFYAGRISDRIGAFTQITAEEGESFSQDNTDIRYADQSRLADKPLSYGVSLNNSPTVQDPWNSTPTWSFPWFEAGYEYGSPDTLIGSLGGSVAGLTAYGFWNQHIYAEAGFYRASNTGGDISANAIDNNAPYWRLAYASDGGELNWMVGMFGMVGDVYDPTESTSSITDSGFDSQLQWMLDNNQSVTVDASYIHEAQPHGEDLNNTMLNATWYPDPTWGLTVGYRGTLSSSHAQAPDDDYRWAEAGDLDSDAFQLQLNYMPSLNTRFALQYTAYAKQNGSSHNASDNNQVMAGGWVVF